MGGIPSRPREGADGGGRVTATISDLVARSAQQAEAAGFHDEDITTPTVLASKLALVHSEVSEVLEEVRAGAPLTRNRYTGHHDRGCACRDWSLYNTCTCRTPRKPEGVPSELADVVIRIFDLAGWLGVDLETAIIEKLDFNQTRSHKHGKVI